ncbi:uncharacterized protein EDB93DRAFT_1103666 [Suillus bovinus]|uniref:uncharacterized protein n=1 Tax=Suillus bovinus TaxID=48563 RepID=UPI001B86D6E8|nr:uncharacterized protein EDB93DRAFT_1103666 [Suillus bovinus]KAG2149103.1 hypothetical protein EDB93DRAFT_1103666 [Suillus bovinus]
MRRAHHRPISRRLAVDLFSCMLQYSITAGGGDKALITTTPFLYHPLVELWLFALEIKDDDVLIIPHHPYYQSPYGPHLASLEMIVPMMLTECMNDKAFMTIILEVSGDIGTVVSTALEYVMYIGSMAQDPNKVTNLQTSLGVLVHTFSNCVVIIIELSKHSAARAWIPIWKITLVWSFEYLTVLLLLADDPIPVLYQALRSYAFEIAMGIQGHAVEVDLNENKKIEKRIRLYASLKSKEEMMRRPSPDEKGWILRANLPEEQCYCGDTTEDTQLKQCSECQIVRYCSKRCQRDAWYSHHRRSCQFLKAAVGSSTPHYVKRSLCLLSGLEDHLISCMWGDIQSQVAAARCEYPQDRDRLVVKQILFSPRTALDMETVTTLSRNRQYLNSRRRKDIETPMTILNNFEFTSK